jgi:hypothetical protein
MAHIQSKPVHDSEGQIHKDFQTVNATNADAGSSHRSPQKDVTHIDNTAVRRPIEGSSHEFEIMGFPWQFVAVIGVIVGSVLVIVLKAIGLF